MWVAGGQWSRRAVFVAGLGLCLVGGMAQAQVVNGGFDNGLVGWNTLGDVSAVSGSPTGGQQLWLTTASADSTDDVGFAAGAFNRSTTGAALVGVNNAGSTELSSLFAGNQLDAAGLTAMEGSAVSQVINAAAGDTLSFSWNYSTRDTAADYAFVMVDGVITRLGDSSKATQAGSGGYTYQTGYTNYAFALSTSGPHQVIFGVVDVGAYDETSALAIDNIRVTAVPEPQSAWLAFAGLGALAALGRKRRQGHAG